MTTGEIIKNLREKSGMTQEQLAEMMGYKHKSSINKIECGKAKLTQEKIKLLATIFKVKPNVILGMEESTPQLSLLPKSNKKPAHTIPVLGKVVAGIPLEAIEEIIDYEEVSEAMASQGEYFALQVKGDSMEPKISEGDVVIVRKQEDVDNGDIAIMLVNGDEATIKKVQKFSGGINLIPSNSAYPVLTYSNEEIAKLPVRCLGKVVELRAKF